MSKNPVSQKNDQPMSEGLRQILQSLQTQRETLKRDLDSTETSTTRTSELLEKLNELRARADVISRGGADK